MHNSFGTMTYGKGPGIPRRPRHTNIKDIQNISILGYSAYLLFFGYC